MIVLYVFISKNKKRPNGSISITIRTQNYMGQLRSILNASSKSKYGQTAKLTYSKITIIVSSNEIHSLVLPGVIAFETIVWSTFLCRLLSTFFSLQKSQYIIYIFSAPKPGNTGQIDLFCESDLQFDLTSFLSLEL